MLSKGPGRCHAADELLVAYRNCREDPSMRKNGF
jgi:hypothetical protein